MSAEQDPIVAEFVVESLEHLSDIENQLLALESAGENIDTDLVNEIFRAVHSIKGAAGFLGFGTLGHLAHDLENVLNLIRNRELVPTSDVTDALLRGSDTLRTMLADVDNSNDTDISNHLEELSEILAGGTSKPVKRHESTEQTSAGEPAPPPSETDTVNEHPADEPSAEAIAVPAVPVVDTPEPPGNKPAAEKPADRHEAETNIRVSVNVLDRLMNLAGELVLSRNQLLQVVVGTGHSGFDSVAARLDQVTSELQEAIMQTRMQAVGTVFNRFPRVVRDLSNQLGKTCRLTMEGEDVELDKSVIEAIGDPLTHLVRNAVDHGLERPEERTVAGKSPEGHMKLRAFHEAGKVNISISDDGKGIDVEKIRQKAVARGLVSSEHAADMSDREALRQIFRPGFSMAEAVTDISGRGVGMDVVKTNIERLGGAVEIETQFGKGTTIHVKLPLTLAIIPSLIVRYGDCRFAVPQSNISELVRIKAEEVGTKIERVRGAEVFRLRGTLLPLVRLQNALDLEQSSSAKPAAETDGNATDRPEDKGPLNIIVVEAGNLRYGLIVDGLHDSEEIVVKPLGRHMQGSRSLAGATILGDGKIALILDVAGIAACAHLALPDDVRDEDDAEAARAASQGQQSVLLFTNHPQEQFAVPMSDIARLERIRGDEIDQVGDRDVLEYRGTSLPILTLEHMIRAVPRDEIERVYVAVFNVGHSEVGLIVPQICDIREIPATPDKGILEEPGVVGSVVVEGKTTRVLDLHHLAYLSFPEWMASEPPQETRAPQVVPEVSEAPVMPATKAILLAEDSEFFRKRVAGLLEGEGFDVTACEDGAEAWEQLNASPDRFDILVTDIEMPNLTGLELTRKVRSEPRFDGLPIVALTTLASEEDIQRGLDAGVDEYQVKLDRECLLKSVAEVLHQQDAEALQSC